MKRVSIIFILITLMISLFGCGCSHDWKESTRLEATCDTDGKIEYICSKCGQTKEEIIKSGHNWIEATCTTAKYCDKCGMIEGEPLGHTTLSGKCDRCGQNVAYTLGSSFEFDDLTVTIGDSYSFTTINNEYSDYYKKTIIRLPVTVKNNKDENHQLNMFFYKFFGSQGTQLDDVSAYFDDEVGWAGEMRSGASYSKAFYILYDGDGTYSIDFDNFSSEYTVEFEVKK